MSERDDTTRIAAMLDGIWASYGGIGQHPPLLVGPSQYARLVAQGCPPGRLRIAEPLSLEKGTP